LTLQRDALARLVDACGTRVECVDGVAWITVDGESRDIVLTRGQSHVVDSSANVIVCAIHGPAAIEVHAHADEAPCGRAVKARQTGVWRGLLAWLIPTSPAAA
jgi:hypothetical protein